MLELENLTVYEAFARSVEKFPDNKALTYLENSFTYKDLDAKVNEFAGKFLNLGVKKGVHVGLWCGNEPNFVITVLALSKIGAVAILFNTSLHKKELFKLVEATDVEFLVIGDGYKDADFRDEADKLIDSIYRLRNVIYIGLSGDPRNYTDMKTVAVVPDEQIEEVRKSIDPMANGYILFTSGTTSLPKAVVGSHYARANMGLAQGNDIETTENDKFCLAMPLFHCFCFAVNLMSALFYGACLCIPKSMHVSDILDTVTEEHCTILSAVPSLYHTIISKYDVSQYDISTLRAGYIGGSTYSASLFEEIEDTLHMTLLSSLGQTEATAGITTARLTDSLFTRSTTVGHFLDHVEYKILSTGEICIRGYNVMSGYYKDYESTSKIIDEDGWLHTGDTGFLVGSDSLVLTGRIKEFIIRGGENISPLEIESVLYDDKRIIESKAVGIYDSHYGEEVALCVIRDPMSSITEKEIRDILRDNIAGYKVPKYILFMENFPKSSSGKVLTKDLKRQATSLLGL